MKIAMVIPDKFIETAWKAASVFKEDIFVCSEIDLIEDDIKNGVFDCVIARGSTLEQIKSFELITPVINVPITSMDIYNSIQEAEKFSSKYSFLIPENMYDAVQKYYTISGEKPSSVMILNHGTIEECIQSILKEGNKAIIGGGILNNYSEKYNFIPIIIGSGIEAFNEAINHAIFITSMIAKSEESKNLLNAVVSNYKDGIIGTDETGKILIANPMVNQILELDDSELLMGMNINIIPDLDKWFSYHEDFRDEITNINGNKVFLTMITLSSGGYKNKIFIFRDLDEIKKLDTKIVRQHKESGHYTRYTFASIVGKSNAIKEAINMAKKYSDVNSTILIEGETGTGKEVFAQSIHAKSIRHDKPFVAVNCAAISESLLESELFGYEGGAFTGADRKGKPGYFEIANGGTIFLDEISEMSASIQSRLLRVLQEKQIMRIGGTSQIPIDVRVIAATNRNLNDLMRKGEFRRDLFYRINVLNLKIPPMRSRSGDIRLLIAYFLKTYAESNRMKEIKIPEDILKKLENYSWPGNIREMSNLCERLSVLYSDGNMYDITLDSIGLTDEVEISFEDDNLKNSELKMIKEKLKENDGNMTATARKLGISRTTLWRKLNS